MTAKEVLKFLGGPKSSKFSVRNNFLSVPNVSWGFLKGYEADLLVVNKNYYVYEVEVKVSAADFRADMKKMKWRVNRSNDLIKRFYYAMPETLWEKVKDEPRVAGSGVITVNSRGKTKIIIDAVDNKQAKALSEKDALRLARLASMRYWKVLEKDS